jgi:hypothetical protein
MDHPDVDFFRGEMDLDFEGATHAEIGAYFLDLWGLPQASIEASLYHHFPESSNEDSPESLRICQTANLLANYTTTCPDAGREALPPALQEYMEDGELLNLAGRLRVRWEESRKAEAS